MSQESEEFAAATPTVELGKEGGAGQPQYGQQQYGGPVPFDAPPVARPAGTGLAGKRRNPFAVWIGLPIITLGIYTLVWIYKTNKELGLYDSRIQVNPTRSVLAYFPGFILIIPPIVATWRLGTRIQQAQHAAGIQESSPVISIVLWYFGFGSLYNQFEINKVWDRYPGVTEGQQVPLAA